MALLPNPQSTLFTSPSAAHAWAGWESFWRGGDIGSAVKNLLASAGDTSSIPGSGTYLQEGNGNPLQ